MTSVFTSDPHLRLLLTSNIHHPLLMRTGGRQLFSSTSLFLVLLRLTRSTLGNVTWVSPSGGDVYGPGDTIVGEWSSPLVIVSPTFRLCFSSSIDEGITARDVAGGCGLHMLPDVQTSSGSYVILLSVDSAAWKSDKGLLILILSKECP
jgi:hypothetical protein